MFVHPLSFDINPFSAYINAPEAMTSNTITAINLCLVFFSESSTF